MSEAITLEIVDEVVLDLETFSWLDLSEVGPHKYAESGEILCAGVSLNNGPVYMWINPKYGCGDPEATYILKKLENPTTTLGIAHNTPFEHAVMEVCGERDMGIKIACQWHDTAVMARIAGLPWNLKDLAELLGTTPKDESGEELIKMFCMPVNGMQTSPIMAPVEFKKFVEYCRQDVKAEIEVWQKLQPFKPEGELLEAMNWDLKLNSRGFPVNIAALKQAKALMVDAEEGVVKDFVNLTGLRPSQGVAIKKLLHELGCPIPDMKCPTVQAWLKSDELAEECPKAIDILDLYQQTSVSAVKKIDSMLKCACNDGTVKDCFLFYGALSGRWAGRRVQPQNFKKPTIHDTDLAYKCIKEGWSAEDLQLIYGSTLVMLSNVIRHFIEADVQLIDADYAQVECRILCWLVGQDDAVEAMAKGEDLYKIMASKIFGVAISEVTDKQRDLGKQAVLGCGYAMGWKVFITTCAKYKIIVDEELAKKTVYAYRDAYPKVAQSWKAMDEAIRRCIMNFGDTREVNKLVVGTRTIADMQYLIIKLPSGRKLYYPNPRIEDYVYADGKRDLNAITYYGRDPYTKKFTRIKTHGGKLIENAVQAIAADCMMHGSLVAEKAGYEIFALIHDQALAYYRGQPIKVNKKGHSTVEEFEKLLAHVPEWGEGLPLRADSKLTPYFKK